MRSVNVFTAVRDWWHRPVLDRLDAIEQTTRRDTVQVAAPRIHVDPSVTADDLAKAVREQMRTVRPHLAIITHGVCGWCEQTVALIGHYSGVPVLADHEFCDEPCMGSGSGDWQAVTESATS